jgi:hypothetical protein
MTQRGRKLNTKLSLVASNPSPTPPEIPSHLGKPERELFQHLTTEYDFATTASVSMLCVALESHMRARLCREQISKDGQTLKTAQGPKAHPLLTAERAAQSQYVGTMKKLLKLVEP